MKRYRVLIDDNYHAMDEGSRYEHGSFETAEAAISACRTIVDSALREHYETGMTAAELFHRYTLFGEEPFIVPLDESAPPAPFSGWDYALRQAEILCSAGAPESRS